ncbi:hypothetical protein [Tissierella sp.]|uniref:hypothetical protein n=1 Tax=Tissierella sp. TaxID=41274 RepID=UPI0028A6C24F|nr:hypothetical protein [Tissierella sp.]
MSLEDRFLELIDFDTVFSQVDYVEEAKGTRRVQKFEKIDSTRGVIVGTCYKYDGYYYPSSLATAPFYDDFESGGLTDRKRVNYWKVVTGMNKEYLVPMDDIEPFRITLGVGSDETK